jgi:hypothetical protein
MDMTSSDEDNRLRSRKRGSPDREDALDEFAKKEPFTVPDGYFEYLPGKIMSRIRKEPQVAAKVFPLYRNKIFITAVAACIMLAAGFTIIFMFVGRNQVKPVPVSALITIRDLNDADFVSSIDDKTLVDLLLESPDTIVRGTQQTSLEKDLGNSLWSADTLITNKDIEDYLVENNELEALLYEPW